MTAGAYYAHQADIQGQLTCFVVTFDAQPGTLSLPWNPDAPRTNRSYELWYWNYLFPHCAVPIPLYCPIQGPPGSPGQLPPPQPPGDDHTTEPPVPTVPPAEGCPPATAVPPDDHATSSEFSQSGQIGGQGGGFGYGPVDQMGQPLVIGMTPLATYSGNGTPLYTQPVEIDVQTREDGGNQVNSLHEGTGPGILCFHPPELIDYMLHGSFDSPGSNADTRWPTELSASTVLLHNCERADGTTGDNSKTYLAFGNPLSGTVKPKSGIYFDYDPATGSLNLQRTDSAGADIIVGEPITIDGLPIPVAVAEWPAITKASTSSEETIFEETIPGGVMNATGMLEWVFHHTWLNNSGVNRNFLLKIYIGGSVIWQDNVTGTTIGSTAVQRTHGPHVMRFKNTGATNTNEFTFGGGPIGSYISAPTAGEGTNYAGSASSLVHTAGRNLALAIDTTDDFNIKITVQMSASASTITGTYAGGVITYHPGV